MGKQNATFAYHLGCLLKFSQSSHSYLISYHKKIGTTNPSILYMGQRPWKSIILHYKSGSVWVDKSLPFVASVQHTRNTNLMIQCEECEMWQLVYSNYKLSSILYKVFLKSVLTNVMHHCVSKLCATTGNKYS